MDHALVKHDSKPALQQPEWSSAAQLARVRRELAGRPPLVRASDTRTLRSLLARVAGGEATVLQCGDCSEDPDECTAEYVGRKHALLDMLAGAMKMATYGPVLRVGRLAGQFGKPRSNATELVGGIELPVYRGHMVNAPDPDAESRRADPLRLLTGYMAANDIVEHLGWRRTAARRCMEPPVWTSHEALLLDYEIPMIRTDGNGSRLLTSTHWPWVGERTREVDGAHVSLLAGIDNPVACKLGPKAEVDDVLGLCERLDPDRDPGRLTFIVRMGARSVAERLPDLVSAVRQAGHPVIWLCDPMHGNTVTTTSGWKTRYVTEMVLEVEAFLDAVRSSGGVAGGMHLETTPDPVTECVADESETDRVGTYYTSFCDPRLNPDQAVRVVSAWRR
ncbi:3-deoxy-7-phosphoheptulonate synthase [Haloechinothrix sp. LS1_15]|uniref:3-deoxy-7-phosphoheptulonate synthase n=1 Tax=Haloechinothrix sp. LS1_15 TaxID=2652248 RepID=UPI0029441195|nr:3-deoxy-7-phosphoheptulonate synthase [Haloechinothrix sp. LS1_15]MDV6011629.1 3-deoxy-7-phosphoheptulonate synthase [Haloechinothrix sp. LS1_15]